MIFLDKKICNLLIIFSNERKFNLNETDDWNYYFYDLRKEQIFIFIKKIHQNGTRRFLSNL